MEAALKATPGVTWRPNLSSTWRGRQVGPYDSVADMPDYYRQIHIYANASAWEGFGFPFLEAAACGRAVVTTDVGCARDLLDSGAGVVLVEDLEALGAAVVGVDYEELGARSAQAVRAAWTWETRAQDWMGVLDGAG
ncbi:MAG: glycosyltransferase [Planctomycetales bacterium]|nr:glycosyltransferase [Planctomycetales bacterium]